MGHHYVPRHYLRGFAPDLGHHLWAYDRAEKRKFQTQVKNLAQETKFYSEELETQLANEVEGPANAVIDKIRAKAKIDANEKRNLAKYLVAQWRRVPKGFQRFKRNLPKISDEVGRSVLNRIDELIKSEPDFKEIGEKRKADVIKILLGYENNPPVEIWHRAISQDMYVESIGKMAQMTWTFISCTGKDFFLTSDNPVFFFSNEGIGNKTSELSFPISSDIALWATHRADLSEGFVSASPDAIREINRRTVSNSTRFVFSGRDEGWILPFVTKNSWRLNRIR